MTDRWVGAQCTISRSRHQAGIGGGSCRRDDAFRGRSDLGRTPGSSGGADAMTRLRAEPGCGILAHNRGTLIGSMPASGLASFVTVPDNTRCPHSGHS